MANGEQDWEKSCPAVELAYNSSIHASTGCSLARFFFGREVELPRLSILPKFNDPEQHLEPCGLEEDMDRVWEEMRVVDEVRIRWQIRAYLGRQKDLQGWGLCVCSSVAINNKFKKTVNSLVRASPHQQNP